jgi:hypothetical protein
MASAEGRHHGAGAHDDPVLAIVRRCRDAVDRPSGPRETNVAYVARALSDADVLRVAVCLATVDGDMTLDLLCEPRVVRALRAAPALRLSAEDVLQVLDRFVSTPSARHVSLDRAYAGRVEMLVRRLRAGLATTLREPTPAERFEWPAVQTALALALHQDSGAEEQIGHILRTQLSRVERQVVDDIRAEIEEVHRVDVLFVQAMVRHVAAALSASWA